MANRTELPESAPGTDSTGLPAPLPDGWLRRYPWATFLLPMFVYMMVGQLEPKPPSSVRVEEVVDRVASSQTATESDNSNSESAGVAPLDDDTKKEHQEDEFIGGYYEDETDEQAAYQKYPYIYTLKIALTMLAMMLVWPGYRTFRWQLSPWSVVVGVVGVILWVGLCHLDLESRLLRSVGLGMFLDQGQRSAFNPMVELQESPLWAMVFLAIRLWGLAIVVPIMEEFFLRGFLMRYVISERWWELPFGKVIPLALLIGTGVPMLMHPGELLAACVWFSLVTWLMIRTRNIWDCVVAHAVTNLLLGIYVISSGEWQLM
ncbi:MAG: CAAX prenyl protease-related protein [Pirellulales bacterium]